MSQTSDTPGAARPNETRPLVSIGLFLHNERSFIEETLASLADQDYENLEILVSDNCSDDGTSEICQAFALADSRVRYERLESNVGVAENSIRVLGRAAGEYFMWASGHDLWSPSLVTDAITALERRPAAVIAYGPCEWIDASGSRLDRNTSFYDTRGMNAAGRLFSAFWGNLHPVLGVIRTKDLRRIPKIHACAGADQIVLAELALAGETLFVPSATWSRREPRGREGHRRKIQRYISKEFGLAATWLDRRFPLLRLPIELLRVAWRSELTIGKRLAVILALPSAFLVRYLFGRDH